WDVFSGTYEDQSDGLFTIIAPDYQAYDIDMGKLLVGDQRDSTIMGFITPLEEYSVVVDSIKIIGRDAADFSMTSGLPPWRVYPCCPEDVAFTFAPTSPGSKTATIEIYGPGEMRRRTIVGEAVEPQLELAHKLIDFGDLYIYFTRDTVEAIVRNTGTAPVDVVSAEIAGPDRRQFELIEGGAPIRIEPDSIHKMKLRFKPVHRGRAMTMLQVRADGDPAPLSVTIEGNGIAGTGRATIVAADASADAGEIAVIHIYMKNQENMFISGAEKFLATLSFNKTLLVPVGDTPAGTIEGENRVINLEFPIPEKDSLLAGLVFRATLGNSKSTVLGLSDVEVVGGIAVVDSEDGLFELTGVCEEGGERLVEYSGEKALAISPNPASESGVVKYTTIEKGLVEITIYNLFGNLVKQIESSSRQPGTYEIGYDASYLPAGTYFMIMKTPGSAASQILNIVR
ncbi:MAG: T9SS type A sorting domain-containing protein, partial [Candidatus Kapaibacterium sp.]